MTDNDLDVIAGRCYPLGGKIQQRYGLAKDDVEMQLSRSESSAGASWFGKKCAEITDLAAAGYVF